MEKFENKKYEMLMDEANTIQWKGHTLHRIKALKDFYCIQKGDLGGYVEKEANLFQEDGDCWAYNNARVYGNAHVSGNAVIKDNAEIYGYAKIYGHAYALRKCKNI